MPDHEPSKLDELWLAVDQMECPMTLGAFDDGYRQAVLDVLDLIEKVGGQYRPELYRKSLERA